MEKTILIVEDNELNMKFLQDLLGVHGYKTVSCNDGIEALRIARDNRPDLVIMDIHLPEVSGLEITKWLKEDDDLRSIPVIAATAYAMKGDEERFRAGGFDDYIAKPFSSLAFMTKVRHHLNQSLAGI